MGMFLFIIVVALVLSLALAYAVRRCSTQPSRNSEGDSAWFCDWGGSDSADQQSHHASPHHGADSGASHHGAFDGGAHHSGFDGGGFDAGGGHH
jgi:hypothetical protein